MASTDNLDQRIAALQSSTQPTPPVTDPPVLRSTLSTALSFWEQSLPQTDTGLPVGQWWSNGGIPVRVKVSS